jgi:hypothetical protein
LTGSWLVRKNSSAQSASCIRGGGYRAIEYTPELVAETYALLMARRHRKRFGKPPWLDDEIYSLVKRVTGWGH